MDWFLYDNGLRHERVQRQTYEMVKHTQTIRQVFPNNCLSVFDHFVRLALKGLKYFGAVIWNCYLNHWKVGLMITVDLSSYNTCHTRFCFEEKLMGFNKI